MSDRWGRLAAGVRGSTPRFERVAYGSYRLNIADISRNDIPISPDGVYNWHAQVAWLGRRIPERSCGSRPPVTFIHREILQCSIFLYPSKLDVEAGSARVHKSRSKDDSVRLFDTALGGDLMGIVEEVPNVVGNAVSWFLDKRGALTVTRSHLGQMRDIVETALGKKRWPPGARTERWASAWSQNGPMLSRTMKSDTFAVVEEVYGLTDDFGRGLAPGERDFDTTAHHPGDDEHFFARYLEALDRADAVLRVHQKR